MKIEDKKRKSIKKSLIFALFIIICLFVYFSGCKTVPKSGHKETGDNENDCDRAEYFVENDLDFNDVPEPSKYIFIRLYDLDYLNPLNPANLLKFGVEKTEVTDTFATHASIGFSLNDEFYGLTSGGEHQLAIESCTDTKSNKFMKKCDPEKSVQYTYALKVTDSEYNDVKKFVESYANSTEIKYDVWKNFSMAKFSTKRKFFTDEDKQQFGTVEYPEMEDKEETKIDNWETHFVCSTFVAYALVVNIIPVRNWFLENEIDYRFVNVTDLVNIPGVSRLFASKFDDYYEAAECFVDKHPEFREYLDCYSK